MSSGSHQLFRADGSPILAANILRDQRPSKPVSTVNTVRYTEPELPSRVSRRGVSLS